MKITIDTKEDSREDILRVIKMLQSLVGSEVSNEALTNQPQQNIFEQSTPELPQGNVLGDFFANMNVPNKISPDKKDDTPKIQEYY